MCDQSFLIQYNDPTLLFTTYHIDKKHKIILLNFSSEILHCASIYIDSKGNTNCSLIDNVNDIETQVNFVTKEILNSVRIRESKEIDNAKNKKKGCCGADKHRSYTNHFKCKVTTECDHS